MIATHGRIWEAASKDDSRPVLTHVFFDADKATLTATDSYIAARVPCQVEDGDESGLIPAIALKLATGHSLRVADGRATVTIVGKRGESETRSWPLGSGTFPDIDKILSAADPVEQPFGLNGELLYRISLALGAGGKGHVPVALHPVSPLKGMRVGRSVETDGVGVIMPVRLSGWSELERRAPEPDFSNPDVCIAAARAAVAQIDGRRGRVKAAAAFLTAAIEATLAAGEAAAGERRAA